MPFEIAGHRLSVHAEATIKERELDPNWIEATLIEPETTILGEDHNMHFTKAIPEFDNRILRVVVNHHQTPNKIVTVFFDRRLKGKK